jgi:hypothetical protein
MKNLLNLLLLAVLGMAMLLFHTGCASTLYPKGAETQFFQRDIELQEGTVTVSPGTFSITGKGLKTSVSLAGAPAAPRATAPVPAADGSVPHAAELGSPVEGDSAQPPPEPPPISQVATPPVPAP